MGLSGLTSLSLSPWALARPDLISGQGEKVKILFDTDIGSDIDDAVCLAYLLAQPRCELMGITTVAGEGEFRAQLASVLCRIAGKDVPIFVGAETPLIGPQLEPVAEQAAALGNWERGKDFPFNHYSSYSSTLL